MNLSRHCRSLVATAALWSSLGLAAPARLTAQTAPYATVNDVYNFCQGGPCPGGGTLPSQNLLQAANGNFYGITSGGAFDTGAFFAITPQGQITSFSNPIYGQNSSPLIQGPDGNLYGFVQDGGPDKVGQIFSMSLNGVFKAVANFSVDSNSNCPVGCNPTGSLMLGPEGNIYGFTERNSTGNGPQGYGTIFSVTTAGKLSTILNLPYGFGAPSSVLMATNGALYATSPGYLSYTGSYGGGTLYELIPGEQPRVSVIHYFSFGTDGGFPNPQLVQGPDGTIYGTTRFGGSSTCTAQDVSNDTGDYFNCGTVFSISPSGEFSTVAQAGVQPMSGLIFAGDTNLYGLGLNSQLYQVSNDTVTVVQDSDYFDGPEYQLLSGNDGKLYGTSVDSLVSLSVESDGDRLAQAIGVGLGEGSSIGQPYLFGWSGYIFSLTMQQCYAYVTNQTTGQFLALGQINGKVQSGWYGGAFTLTPSEPGVYLVAVTCGGVETGFATVNVAETKLPTSLFLSISPDPVLGGEDATLIASTFQQGNTNYMPPPSGNVTFSAGAIPLGTAPLLSNGTATLVVPSAHVPPNSQILINASYPGDNANSPSSTSGWAVTRAVGTTTGLTLAPNPVTPGQLVTIIATVDSTGIPATGIVTFGCYESSLPVLTAALINGTATVQLATGGLEPGYDYYECASYRGDSYHTSSASPAVQLLVQ